MSTQHSATLLGATYCASLATLLRCVAMCCKMLGVGGSNLTKFNSSQQCPTCRKRVVKHAQHVAPSNVATCCIEMLQIVWPGLKVICRINTLGPV